MNLSKQWNSLGKGKKEMKKQRAANKKLVTGYLTWLILLGETSYNIETS